MIFAATELDLLCGFIGGLFLSLSSSLHLALKGYFINFHKKNKIKLYFDK